LMAMILNVTDNVLLAKRAGESKFAHNNSCLASQPAFGWGQDARKQKC
jgi:hypothetical protein